MASLDTSTMVEIADVDRLIKEHDRDVKRLKERRQVLEEKALEALAEAGTDSLRVTDGAGVKRTVSMQSRVMARNLQGPAATAEALRAAGFGDMVESRANGNQVNSLMSDLVSSGQPLPSEFDGIVEPYEKYRISVTKA